MAHAKDYTLLARLGFADPDKGDQDHQDACFYLAGNEAASALLGSLGLLPKLPDGAADQKPARGKIEVPVSKGTGQYKTTIGFLDVLIRGSVLSDPASDGKRYYFSEFVAIEVKSHPVPVSDILRQIKLYREYLSESDLCAKIRWVAALIYDITEDDAEAMRGEGVIPIRLGAKFREWQKQRTRKAATMVEV